MELITIQPITVCQGLEACAALRAALLEELTSATMKLGEEDALVSALELSLQSFADERCTAVAGADKRRYYVVFGCKLMPSARGIWHCEWSAFERAMPGGKFIGSGAKMKGADTEEMAMQVWYDQAPTLNGAYIGAKPEWHRPNALH